LDAGSVRALGPLAPAGCGDGPAPVCRARPGLRGKRGLPRVHALARGEAFAGAGHAGQSTRGAGALRGAAAQRAHEAAAAGGARAQRAAVPAGGAAARLCAPARGAAVRAAQGAPVSAGWEVDGMEPQVSVVMPAYNAAKTVVA